MIAARRGLTGLVLVLDGLGGALVRRQPVGAGRGVLAQGPDEIVCRHPSDEEDDGIGLSMTDAYNGHNFYAEGLTTFRFTEDDMISYLQSVKGAGKFAVSTITPTRNARATPTALSSDSSTPRKYDR